MTGLGQDQVRALGQKTVKQRAGQWLPGDRRWKGGTSKEHRETFGNYPDFGDHFMDVYVHQNSSNCLLMFVYVYHLHLNKDGKGDDKRGEKIKGENK